MFKQAVSKLVNHYPFVPAVWGIAQSLSHPRRRVNARVERAGTDWPRRSGTKMKKNRHATGKVVSLNAWVRAHGRLQALAAREMCGANIRTVSSPGDLVSPDATLRRVWKGTRDSSASACSCAGVSPAKADRTSSGLGTVSFMGEERTASGTSRLPFSVHPGEYPTGMPGDQAKAVIVENVKLLMTTRYGKINITAFGRDTGINNGGTQRVLDPETSVGVDLLARIADHFKIEVWQLLAPNLGQALTLSPAEMEAVRKIREPQQPKGLTDKAKTDVPFNLGASEKKKGGKRAA